jgi:hypothetical protein
LAGEFRLIIGDKTVEPSGEALQRGGCLESEHDHRPHRFGLTLNRAQQIAELTQDAVQPGTAALASYGGKQQIGKGIEDRLQQRLFGTVTVTDRVAAEPPTENRPHAYSHSWQLTERSLQLSEDR